MSIQTPLTEHLNRNLHVRYTNAPFANFHFFILGWKDWNGPYPYPGCTETRGAMSINRCSSFGAGRECGERRSILDLVSI